MGNLVVVLGRGVKGGKNKHKTFQNHRRHQLGKQVYINKFGGMGEKGKGILSV